MTSNAPSDPSPLDASSSGAQPLQPHTFTHFPHLPKELRLSIWETTLPKGRIISIHRRSKKGGTRFRLVLPQSDLPQLYTCHESRVTALKVYQTRQYKQLGCPYYFNLKTDAIMLSGIELIGEFCYNKGPVHTSIRDMTHIAGVALGHRDCHGSPDGQGLVGSFWRVIVLQRLCLFIEVIGTLELLFVFHPQCLGTGLDEELKVKVEEKQIQRELKQSSSDVGGSDVTMPVVIWQAYDDDLDIQGAENRIRELMETHEFQKG